MKQEIVQGVVTLIIMVLFGFAGWNFAKNNSNTHCLEHFKDMSYHEAVGLCKRLNGQ